jgi:tetratricopeptide (TPR) repeat protein
MGTVLRRRGFFRETIRWYEEISPSVVDLPDRDLDLGHAYLGLGRFKEAETCLTEALRKDPQDAETWYRLGIAYALERSFDQAAGADQKALGIRPGDPDFLAARAYLLKATGRSKEGEDYYRRAVHADPNTASRMDREAWRMATHPYPDARNGAYAVFLATQACELTDWENAQFLDTLGAAQAETGSFEEAAKTAARAVHLAAHESADQAARMRARAELYNSGQPFRETVGMSDSLWRNFAPGR